MNAELSRVPYKLIDRRYIPIETIGRKVPENLPYHILETTRRMYDLSVFSFDIDGFITRVSPSPYRKDGSLDKEKLDELSPHTYPILERLAILATHIPCIPNTGKSYMVKRTLYAEIESLRMRYMASEGMGVVVQGNDRKQHFIPNPRFVESNSGRMFARDRNGEPSKKWLQYGISVYDNGGYVEDTYGPDIFTHREKFSSEYFLLFTNPEFQRLILKTTRSEKIKQQAEIMKYHVLMSDATIDQNYPNNTLYTDTSYEAQYIRSGLIAKDASYTSPGAKNNFDLDIGLLEHNEALQKEWDEFFYKFTFTDKPIRSFADFQQNLDLYFRGVASVSSNYVPGNPESGIGERMAIDLTPKDVNKEWGLYTALRHIQVEQAKAGMVNSLFEEDMIAGGDGAHRDKNDFHFIYDKRGITNTPNYSYNSVEGFPTHIRSILPVFGITELTPLDQIEYTLVFVQLMLHARLGFPKNDLPESTLAKLRFS